MKENARRAQQRQQWEQMKHRPRKEQISYLFTYYRNYIFLLLAAVAVLTYIVHEAKAAKDTVLHVRIFNVMLQKGLDPETIGQEFFAYGDLNPQKQEIILDDEMQFYSNGHDLSAAGMMLMTRDVASGEIDAMLTTDTWIKLNRDNGMFADLSEILPQELLEAYRDQIFYLNSTVDDKGEFPVAIDVSRSSLMLSPDLPAYFCITSTAENRDYAVLFLRYLLETQEG